MAQRILTFRVSGVDAWLGYDVIAQSIAQALVSNGWGLQNFTFDSGLLSTDILFQIQAFSDENPERVRQALLQLAAPYYWSLYVTLDSDNLQQITPGGQIVVTDTVNDRTTQPAQPSLWEQIFGKDTSAVDAGGKFLGISIGTIFLIGVGYLVITKASERRR